VRPLFCLGTSVLLFLVALLAIVPAPANFLFLFALLATEEGQALALICLCAVPFVWSGTWSGHIAAVLCLAAALIALTPLFRATNVARTLPQDISKVFGHRKPERPPLVALDLLRGLPLPSVKPQLIKYKSAGGPELEMDFYGAQTPAPSPVIIAIHGGAWNSGDNKKFTSMDHFFTARGFAVADVLYRLAPQSPFPAASIDIHAAMDALRERADTLHIDPDRFVLLGRSAGGQIALHVAYTANDPRIRGVVSLYGPTDMIQSWEHPGNPWVIDMKAVLTDYLGGSPSQFPEQYTEASPIRLANPSSPPTLLLHGRRDEFISAYHSVSLARRLTELGVANLNIPLPWATHAFDYFISSPGGQISTYAIETFLNCVLK